MTAFAVEAGRLETEPVGNDVQYRFSVSLVLADTARQSVSDTHDTVFVRVPRAMADDHLLFTHVEMLAPPSGTTQQRVIMYDATAPGIGQLYSDAFPIPDYTGTGLMLSDIALGHPDAQAGWRRGDVTLALLPTTQFPTSAFDVYYEIYNLSAGSRYDTEVVIHEEGDASVGYEPVRLRFSGVAGEAGLAPDGALAELRRVEASLPRGSYRLTVTVTDPATRRSASRSRAFHVHGNDRGATMVAALPHSRTRR